MDQILPIKKEEKESKSIIKNEAKKQKTSEDIPINAPGTSAATIKTAAAGKGKKPVNYILYNR